MNEQVQPTSVEPARMQDTATTPIPESTPKEEKIKVLDVKTLKNYSMKKNLMLSLLIALFLPVIILQFINYNFNLNFFVIDLSLSVILFILSAFIINIYLEALYKCPKCNSLWAFQKTNETLVESYISQVFAQDGSEPKNYKNERYIIDYECTQCKFKNFNEKKIKKLVSK